MRDPYRKAIRTHWPGILALYKDFEDKKPAMHFERRESWFRIPWHVQIRETDDRGTQSESSGFEAQFLLD